MTYLQNVYMDWAKILQKTHLSVKTEKNLIEEVTLSRKGFQH